MLQEELSIFLIITKYILKDAEILMHGEEWDWFQDLKGFSNKSINNLYILRWMSEKFDGVRAYWSGQRFISRYGKEIWCPSWFIEKLPKNISLDGELWINPGILELLIGILKSKDEFSWKNISYMVFDSPSSKESYEIRIRNMANLILPNRVHIVNVERCRGSDHIQKSLVKILEVGGEGLMVNKPNSIYDSSRTDKILKVKVS